MSAAQALSYEQTESIAKISLDDGKANVMSPAMLEALHAAFTRAEADAAVKVVLLTGRPGIFSGGYDLAVFRSSRAETSRMLRAGGNLTHRMLGFPKPVVIACNGHAIAQGAFTLLAADVRIGVTGADRKIGLNEVMIGMTIPHYAIALSRARLAPAWFNHATVTGTLYDPQTALTAGFFDRLVSPDELATAALAEAQRLTQVNLPAHAGTKLRTRAVELAAVRAGVDQEFPQ